MPQQVSQGSNKKVRKSKDMKIGNQRVKVVKGNNVTISNRNNVSVTTITTEVLYCSEYDHAKKSAFTEEWNKLYCIGSRYLSGCKCVDCNKRFSDTMVDSDCFVPSNREPAYVCYNYKGNKGCHYGVCYSCYMKKKDGAGDRNRRKRNLDD